MQSNFGAGGIDPLQASSSLGLGSDTDEENDAQSQLVDQPKLLKCYSAYTCPVKGCEKLLKYKSHLEDHMLRRHSDERPFVCLQCDHAAKTQSDFNMHKKVHDDKRETFSCRGKCRKKGCRSKFFTKSNLARHITCATGEKMHCASCNYSTRSPGDFKRHFKWGTHRAVISALAEQKSQNAEDATASLSNDTSLQDLPVSEPLYADYNESYPYVEHVLSVPGQSLQEIGMDDGP